MITLTISSKRQQQTTSIQLLVDTALLYSSLNNNNNNNHTMAASLKERADAARKEIGTLTAQIDKTLTSKRDKGIGLMQTVKNSGKPLAPIREPPSQLKCRRKLQGHFGKITAMDWSADGNTIVSASQDGNLLLWDAFSTSKKQDVRLKSSYVMSVCMEQTTGEYVAAGGLDNACSVYSVGDNNDGNKSQLKTELVSHEGYLAACKFFHSPSKMLTGSADSTCLLWDVNTGQIIDTYAEHSANIIEMELVGQHNFLSTSVDKTIKLWDTRTSASKSNSSSGSVQTFTGHTADVNGITLLKSSNGTTFATCSGDGTVRVWDMRSYGEISQFGEIMDSSECDPFSDGDAGFTSITSSASGRLLFVGHSEGTVECYDILQQPNMDLDPMYMLNNAHETHVSCVSVSPTGDVLCTGSWDTQLKLFA